MKIAFIVGHSKMKKGAFSAYFKRREYDLWKGFECELKELGDVFYHDNILFYNIRQKNTAKKTLNYDIVIELHFNAHNTITKGCEVLYMQGNNETRLFAERFCKYYTTLSGTNNRGSKPLFNKTQRGYGFLKHQRPNALILEPFFGDNIEDCFKFSIENFIYSLRKTFNL